MEAILVFIAFEVLSPQLQNLAIIPPQKCNDDRVKEPSDCHLAPLYGAPNIERGDVGDPRRLLLELSVGHVEGHQDCQANEGQHEEHVAAHADETEKDGCVHSYLVDQAILLDAHDGLDPRPRALAYRRGGMLLISMFDLRGVDGLVVRSNEGEEDGDGGSDAEGDGQGREDGG